VDAQEIPSPAQSAPIASQGEKRTVGDTQRTVPSQNEQPKQETQSNKNTGQPKQETQPEKNAPTTEQQTSDEQKQSEQQTESPPIVSESQPGNIDSEKQPKHIVSQSPSGPLVDQAPPSDRDYEVPNARVGIGLEIDTVWNTDPGFDLFSEDDVSTQIGVWFSYDLLPITEQLTLAGEVGLGVGGAERQPQKDIDLTWSMNSFNAYIAANLRLQVFPWMLPHIKLGCGALFGTLELELKDQKPVQTESEDTISPLGTIGAGVTFQTPKRMFESSDGTFASLSLGLLIEAGYTIASSMSLTLKTDRDKDPIENRTAELGELDLSGPYIRTSVLVRF